jgi:hypothetical protein
VLGFVFNVSTIRTCKPTAGGARQGQHPAPRFDTRAFPGRLFARSYVAHEVSLHGAPSGMETHRTSVLTLSGAATPISWTSPDGTRPPCSERCEIC